MAECFNSNAVTGTSNGLLASLFNITMPKWWCLGLFPSAVVLGLHYAPFAYILIGGIFRNMDANLEEAATILDTPKWKTMFRITLPMVNRRFFPQSCWYLEAPWEVIPYLTTWD